MTPAVATFSLKNTILDSSGVSNVENARLGADPGQAVVNGDATDILLASAVNNGGLINDGGILITDPLLGPLSDNGGPTATHAPQFPGSPAIDAGDAGTAIDQRGVARPQGPGFDIGSVEVPRFTGALAPGDLLLTEFYGGSVVDIQGGGDFTLAPRFAYGLDQPFGICTGPGSEVYVTEFFPGEVTVVTAGGDFTSATPFATGLDRPVNLVCSDTQILVAEFGAGEVTDITAGGDVSAATPFAFGLGSGELVGLFRDSGGTLWASNQLGRVHDITAGGDFSADPGFAHIGGGDLRGVTERGSALLVTSSGTNQVLDFSAGGDLSAAPVFATVPGPTEIVDLGPVGLFTPLEVPPVVYEISAGGDFTTAEPFATGLTTGGGFADLALIEGCGDGILDPATEECDDANLLGGDGCSATCTIRCAPAPAPMCNAAMAASVKLDERKSGREKLSASLKKVTGAVSQADFGDPVGGDTRFALCLYDGGGTLVLDLRVDRAGELCGTKQKPCWKALGMQGYGYKDGAAEADGVTKLVAKGGAAGKGSLSLQGRNNQPKGQTDLPTGAAALLAGETSATLQLLASDGACFGAALRGAGKPPTGSSRPRRPSAAQLAAARGAPHTAPRAACAPSSRRPGCLSRWGETTHRAGRAVPSESSRSAPAHLQPRGAARKARAAPHRAVLGTRLEPEVRVPAAAAARKDRGRGRRLGRSACRFDSLPSRSFSPSPSSQGGVAPKQKSPPKRRVPARRRPPRSRRRPRRPQPTVGEEAARAEARQSLQSRCVTCHGPLGAGDGPASKGLTPPPRTPPRRELAGGRRTTSTLDHHPVRRRGGRQEPGDADHPDLTSKPEVVAALREYIRGLSRRRTRAYHPTEGTCPGEVPHR